MSGTEAVMAAVRLARFNTRRKLIVCFAGAYHGWWDGCNRGWAASARSVTVLHSGTCIRLRWRPSGAARTRSPESWSIRSRSFHPNAPPPSDAILVTSGVRKTEDGHARYADWLRRLRDVCTACDVPLIFDEVYSGFRLAPGGAQEYFNVQADLVVYGKTVGGGTAVGVVCGKKQLMRRFDPEHPMRIAYVIGTFSAHPHVMGAMNEFLRWAIEPDTAKLYEEANARCTEWARDTNERLGDSQLPMRVARLATVWTCCFCSPVATTGCSSTICGPGRHVELGRHRAVPQQHGFHPAALPGTSNQAVERCLEHETRRLVVDGAGTTGEGKENADRSDQGNVGSIVQVPKPLKSFYVEVMRRKHDDHIASHSHPVNQLFHIISSSVFLYCYFLIFTDLTTAVACSLAALFLRQFGHAVIEPPCHDKEELLLGFNTPNKTLIVAGYVLIPVVNMIQGGIWTFAALADKFRRSPVSGSA